MNRKDFLRKLSMVIIGAATAPLITSDIEKNYPFHNSDSNNICNDSHNIHIARRYGDITAYIDGTYQNNDKILIDEMAIWNRRLTNEEIVILRDRIRNLKNNHNLIFLF